MPKEIERDVCDEFNDIIDRGEVYYVCPDNPGFFNYATPDRGLADRLAAPLEGCGWKGWKVFTQAEVDAWRAAKKGART